MRTKWNMLLTMAAALSSVVAFGQKFDQDRMERDIAVAENVLVTLIKQQFTNQRMFFPLQVNGSYQNGYGVTFALPADYTTPIAFQYMNGGDAVTIGYQGGRTMNVFSSDGSRIAPSGEPLKRERETAVMSLEDKAEAKATIDMDSIRDASNQKVIDAAKTFLLDYGDLIAQLAPNERVVVTNQGNQPRAWVNQFFSTPKRRHLSVEALKSDLAQLREGKITRQQAADRIKIINTESVEEVAPDLELLSSIFTRLYSEDISKTYFVGDNVTFERLKDFGAIYYMTMYSSIELGDYSRRYVMPTVGLMDVDQATKDKKVTELYPKFEADLKENIIEYGRTVKSLRDDEVLVFQVTLGKCPRCSVPSTLEVSIKGSALRDYSSGKSDKAATLSKFSIRKGSAQ